MVIYIQLSSLLTISAMKWEVMLYVGGQTFNEIVIARNMNDARKTALARNPTARVISVTASFK